MTTNLERFARRNRQYWYVDGVNEVIDGILFILLGLLFYARSLVSTDSHLAEAYSTAQNILLTAGIGVSIVFIRWLKERSTYPRTGYISYQPMTKKQIWTRVGVSIGIFLLLTITLIFCFFIFPVARRILFIGILWLPFLMGVALGANWIFLGVRNDMKRFYLIGGISLLVGFGLGYLSVKMLPTIAIPSAVFLIDSYGQMPYELISPFKIISYQVIFQAAIYCGLMGFVLLISGIFVRHAYLHQNPVLPEEQP